MAKMYFGDQEQDIDFEALANQVASGEAVPQEPFGGMGGDDLSKWQQAPQWPMRRNQSRQKWAFDPITGKSIGGMTETPGQFTLPKEKGVIPPPTTPAYDFWGKVGELIGGEDGASAEDIALLREAFEGDPKWKAPTSSKAQRLMSLAMTFKNLGYDADLGSIVSALFDMGYRQPAFSLSMFSSLLKPYGLGTSSASSSSKSSSAASDDDISAMLAQLGL